MMKILATAYPALSLVLGCLLLLVSCSSSNPELKKTQVELAQMKSTIEENENDHHNHLLALPKPVTYQAYINPTTTTLNAQNPLEAYPLALLQFVGTLSQHNQTVAYILTPDGEMHEAKMGDLIGENYGRITKIDSTHVEVTQKILDANKQSTAQVVSLQIKD